MNNLDKIHNILAPFDTDPIGETIAILNAKIQEVQAVLDIVIQTLEEVKKIQKGEPGESIKGDQGDPGVSPDIETIKEAVLGEIHIPTIDIEKLTQDILAKIPPAQVIDEKALATKILHSLPENKASLKIIRESFEIDPLSVVEKIMSLPEGKFKLTSKHIDGLEQTLTAFQNQLGRGYLHGGGDTVIAGTNVTIDNVDGKKRINATSSGSVTNVTATSPLTSNGGNTPNISTLMSTNKLVGRGTSGTGVMEEITLGTGLSLSGTTLNASGSSGIAIGDAISGGTVGSLLFVGTGPVLAQDNSNLFWDDTNNRLGIGTATPTQPLDVSGGAGTSSGHFNTTGLINRILIDNTNSSPNAGFGLQANGSTVWSVAIYDSGFTMGKSSFTLYNDQAGTPGLFIDGLTNTVGILTNNPFTQHSVKLDVEGAVYANAPETNTIWNAACLYLSGTYVGFRQDTNHNFNIDTYNNNSPLNVLTVTQDGKMGIGTNTPGSKLSIIGLPTSAAGLSTGDIWNNSGVLNIV